MATNRRGYNVAVLSIDARARASRRKFRITRERENERIYNTREL